MNYLSDAFLKYWFKGFENAINHMNINDSEAILKQCGRACSDSYTKQVYIEEYAHSKSIEDFLNRLKERFSEIEYQIIKDDEIILLTYNHCACELVQNGFISTPLLCECSRQSLLYNWETVMGERVVKIELIESILRGSSHCRFEIYLK